MGKENKHVKGLFKTGKKTKTNQNKAGLYSTDKKVKIS